ncbi:MAG: RagB/SusD family nutrient uptake outer membrane protein, partial [Muribaculaceae bacterium]|nr:RagB/SusD family nutrient uptake outer membrane protein [Muribaculaceae bacterium]
MKKKFIIAAAAIMSIMATSCNEMDQYPHNGVSSDNLTETDAQLLLTGLYFYAEAKPTTDGYLAQDILGGDLVRGGATGLKDPVVLVRDLVTPESGFVSGPWNGYYTGLYQINSLIRSLNGMAPTQARNEMLGTASFFRGLFYYNLVSRYGEVPILEEPFDGDIAASSEADGWAFVEKNFQTAIDYCPVFTDKNYVSQQAAKALMARTKLAMGKKAEAAVLAEELINDANFALDDFDKIFRAKANREEIFTFSNLLTESGLKISASLYTRAHPNGGSGTYAPTSEGMNMYSDDDNRKAISIDRQEANDVVNKYPGGEINSDP